MLRYFHELPNTQDYCLKLCRHGRAHQMGVYTHYQTHPRGSRGRQWISMPKNLALSIILALPDGPIDPAIWSFIGALGFYDGLVKACPQAESYLAIKWPNDILLGLKKLGGVLVEFEGRYAVIGIGGNVTDKPSPHSLQRNVASLVDMVRYIPPLEDVARCVFESVKAWYERYEDEGFDVLREGWCARSIPLNTRMTISAGGHIYSGNYAGLSREGYLKLQTMSGLKIFMTADILHLGGEE